MAKDAKPQRKEYSLKDIEVQMFYTINAIAQNSMSNFASYILMDRMAYTVTPQSTKFELDFEKKTITVWEEPAEAQSTEQPPKAEVIK